MPANTVTRPSASVVEEPRSGQTPAPNLDWSLYVKWGLIAALVLGAIGLMSSLYVTYSEKSRIDKLRGEWDEYASAISEKKSNDEQMEALEKLADNARIKGTAVHAYVLATLAHANFDIAQNPRRLQEARGSALERAIVLYKMLATTEPFKSNPSFGPMAVQNLALCYEQKQVNDPGTQFYDEAINSLHGALFKDESKEADPVKTMKTHFLFNKMNAQLGRLYWLRGLRKTELKKEELDKADSKNVENAKLAADVAKVDNEWALYYIKPALESGVSSVEKERFGLEYKNAFGTEFKGTWRDEATYIKSLLDPPGKMMADGKAPPMKVEVSSEVPKTPVPIAAAPTGAIAPATTAIITTTSAHNFVAGQSVTIAGVGTPGFNGTFKIAAVPTPATFTYAVAAPLTASGGGTATGVDEKKDDAKKDDAKKEPEKKDVEREGSEKKDNEKKEPEKKDADKKDPAKKTGSLQRNDGQDAWAGSSGESSQHLSYSQIQALLKQGRPALCQCPRCASSDKNIGAKLTE